MVRWEPSIHPLPQSPPLTTLHGDYTFDTRASGDIPDPTTTRGQCPRQNMDGTSPGTCWVTLAARRLATGGSWRRTRSPDVLAGFTAQLSLPRSQGRPRPGVSVQVGWTCRCSCTPHPTSVLKLGHPGWSSPCPAPWAQRAGLPLPHLPRDPKAPTCRRTPTELGLVRGHVEHEGRCAEKQAAGARSGWPGAEATQQGAQRRGLPAQGPEPELCTSEEDGRSGPAGSEANLGPRCPGPSWVESPVRREAWAAWGAGTLAGAAIEANCHELGTVLGVLAQVPSSAGPALASVRCLLPPEQQQPSRTRQLLTLQDPGSAAEQAQWTTATQGGRWGWGTERDLP